MDTNTKNKGKGNEITHFIENKYVNVKFKRRLGGGG
jgi:hypothetical protein